MDPVARGRIRFTRTDLEALPEDWRAELHEGDLVMVPAPDPYHQHIVMRLAARLQDHLGPRQTHRVLVAPVDIVVSDETVLQPDLLVLPDVPPPVRRPWKIPRPIWVAEILSPKTAERDRGIKMRLYAVAGVKEAWLVDDEARTIEVRDLAGGGGGHYSCGETAPSRTLPGFALPVCELF
ncbi:MAG: Uma2 family endonuclease [Planctomycetaceae bacterium]